MLNTGVLEKIDQKTSRVIQSSLSTLSIEFEFQNFPSLNLGSRQREECSFILIAFLYIRAFDKQLNQVAPRMKQNKVREKWACFI